MSRSIRFLMPALLMATTGLALLVGGCTPKAEAPKADVPGPDTPKADAPAAPKPDAPEAEAPKADAPKRAAAAPPPADGWTRIDLAQHGLKGTVDVPTGTTVDPRTNDTEDADGLKVKLPVVRLGERVCGAELRPVIEPLPRLKSAEAMARFHGRFEQVATHAHGAEHWSVVQKWRPGECMLHGWSGEAGLICDVFKCPCDQMQRWVDVCGTLRPGDGPVTVETRAAVAFEKLAPAQAEAAMIVARAVARNDAVLLKSAMGPAGLEIGGKRLTAQQFDAAVKGKAVMQLVAPDWFATVGADPEQLNWTAELWNGTARVFFSSGYGEQPYFTLARTGDAWHVAAFAVEDLGEP